MHKLHPSFLEKNGKKEFAILSYNEYCKIQQIFEDYEDLIDLRKAKKMEKDSSTISLKETKKELGL